MIDEQPPHHVRRDGEEVRAVLPPHAALVDQLQVGLVHERRRRAGNGRGARAARIPGAIRRSSA